VKLVTIGFSHYCEKARWALDRSGAEYTEESHAPIAHFLAVFRAGGRRTVPVLITDDGVFGDSTDILKYIDPFVPEDARLYPDEPNARREVLELEDLFDRNLGPLTRRWAYAWLLDEDRVIKPMFEKAMTPGERRLSSMLIPLTKVGLRKNMKLSPSVRESAFEKIRALYDEVDKKWSSGKFLCGDKFSAADLTLASLSIPVLLPEENPWPPPMDIEMPPRMKAQMDELRATRVGQHALQMYREERARRFTREK
jgi:glutathione S-transferase